MNGIISPTDQVRKLPQRTGQRAASCGFITAMTSLIWDRSLVVRFTSSAPCSAPKTKRATFDAGAASVNSPRAARVRGFW
jgi:hypothetical protein